MVGGRGWRLMGGKRAGIYVHSQPPAANTTCPGDRNREQLFISDDSIVVCWLDTIVPYEMEPRADGMLEEEEEHSSKKEGTRREYKMEQTSHSTCVLTKEQFQQSLTN